MHYFDFNIKSYQAATAHLTNEEDLAYRRLLEMYYDTELPISKNPNKPTALRLLSRRLRVGIEALEIVLAEFFTEGENDWSHTYCDQKISEFHAFKEKQRANGSKGGRGKKAVANPNKPTALPPQTQNNPSPSQQETINNKPINKNLLAKPADAGQAEAGPSSPALPTKSAAEYPEAFTAFWNAYPRREHKGAAFKAWKKIPAAARDAVMAGLERKKLCQQWRKDNGQFVPHPASWLNARGWEDEDAQPKSSSFNMSDFMRSVGV